ncbi:MAG: hypothetical protein H0T66_13320 [Geodermatophilaceae bacterium]|nr:hypothetical protein [Geodermatophilaceae bacterium]
MSYRSSTGPFALGTATGARNSLGLATLAFSERRPRASRSMTALQSPSGRVVAAVLVGLELVGDKLPTAPSRLKPPILMGRLLVGGLGGAVLAQRGGRHLLLGGLLGGTGAATGAFGGFRGRQAVAGRDWPDLPAAVAEDALALGLACAARALDAR